MSSGTIRLPAMTSTAKMPATMSPLTKGMGGAGLLIISTVTTQTTKGRDSVIP